MGMPLKHVKENLTDFQDTVIWRATVLEWVRKYSKLLEEKTEKVTPKIKGQLHNDEFFVQAKKTKMPWMYQKDKIKF